jgi:hypothetical protein
MTRITILALLAATGCTVGDDTFTLDHARILAVRSTPPTVPIGMQAKIDVLCGDAAGDVFVVDPTMVDAEPATAARGSDGWYVTAQPGMQGATLNVLAPIDGVDYPADKEITFGGFEFNPDVTAIAVDGVASTSLQAGSGGASTLTAKTTPTTQTLSYAWYSSVGKLDHARDAAATLEPSAAKRGLVLVVVRDTSGGVGWQTLDTTVH